MDHSSISSKTLAFLGDAAWTYTVRYHLINEGNNNAKKLQALMIDYVSAKAQADFYSALHEEGFFNEEEENIFHRGRNGSIGSVPHNTDVQTYRISTGFEAIIGALTLENNNQRIEEIWEKVRTL